MKWLKCVGASVVLASVVGCAGSAETKPDTKAGTIDKGAANTAMEDTTKHMNVDAATQQRIDAMGGMRPGGGAPGGVGPGVAGPGGAPGGAAPGGAAPGGAAPKP